VLVTGVASGVMVISGFVIADVPKLVNNGDMVSGYVLMLMMCEIRSPYYHIGEPRKNI
jgi:hypothetical protein